MTVRRYTPAWSGGQLEEVEEVDLEELLEQMNFALEMADRNARLIHPIPWQEAQVGLLAIPCGCENASSELCNSQTDMHLGK